ncbi:MAG: DUF924 family protein [Thiotrichaceae bacterium]
MPIITAKNIVDFWFSDESRSKWFSSTAKFDQILLERYEQLWIEAKTGKLEDWTSTPTGCLALIIILDQLPLNMFRGLAKSFQTEARAIEVCKIALNSDFHHQLPLQQRAFLYMPLMHSENLDDQDLAVSLFAADDLSSNLRFAKHHRELIRKFDRFPHRNVILGRKNTKSESDYLNSKEAFTG